MPAKGTPVFVDMRAGRFWSGEGLLLEVNEDETRCRVAVRDRALVVHKMWETTETGGRSFRFSLFGSCPS